VDDLDALASVPSSTASVGVSGGGGGSSAVSVDVVETEESADKPEDGAEEGECLVGFEVLALSWTEVVGPVKGGAACVTEELDNY
jgi:hypothetical protein